jgi:type VI secretion system secreted protein VgrG
MPEATPLQMVLTTSPASDLNFRSLSGREEVSRLFEYQVLAISEKHDIAADDLLGHNAAVSMALSDDQKRWFHGLIAAFGIEGVDGRYFKYRLTLRPWMWLLTRSSNIRIFQEKTAADIIKEVLGAYTGTVVDELSATYGTRTYCVQYRETDFNFVSRLMEEEGIFYFFRHSADKHELVLADASTSHQAFENYATIPYDEDEEHTLGEPAISQWRMRHEIQSGKFTLNDYNFETPSTSLKSTTAATAHSHTESTHEVYDYPGLYGVKGDGDTRATVRLGEADSRHARFTGQGNTPGLQAGCKFTLAQHPRADQNADYTVLATLIEMRQAGYEAGDQMRSQFGCSFEVQKYAEPLRPQRITRKPSVAGPQTAVVVGDGDDGDIIADKYGRVKVQFHWDRLGAKDATSSCWIRVASPMAGNGYGFISLPRLGQEVVVDFLEGDPDQPLITGRVHNAEQLPPYVLPDNVTVSTWKSRSKQGETDAFNEIRFEDKAGSEYVLYQAQKDQLEFVEKTLKSSIGEHEHRSVKENRKEKIEGEYHLKVVKDVKQKIDGKMSLGVVKDILIKGDGIYSLKTAKDITAQSGAAISMKSSTDMHLKIGTNLGADAGQNVHIKGGMNVVIEGGIQVSIKAGGSSVVLGPDGVSITGAMVKINSGGSPGSGGGASPVAPTDPDAPEDPEMPEDPLSHR